MAEVVVSPVVELVFSKLTSLTSTEFGLVSGVKKDLSKLSDTLSTIRLVLDDAEAKQIKDKSTRIWLRKLKDAAYDAEDILDECALEFGKQVSTNSLSTCFDVKQLLFRHKMGKRVEEIRGKLDEIASERSKFHLIPGVADTTTGVTEFGPDRETSSVLTEPLIYGRDEDRENIVTILLENGKSQNSLSICPILGIGGLGKTTLAQLVYNDVRVVDQFDTRIWVCVCDDFSLKRVTKMIIEFLSEKGCDLADLNPMQNYIQKLLNKKKFLLVLDDVWDDDIEKWTKMKHLLTCGGEGSSVIVTTRLQTVVDSICFQTFEDYTTCIVNPTHNLKFLSKHDCCCLFKQYAFGIGIQEIAPNLIKMGEEIVSKCGGVPLAVKALGSLLNSKTDEFWSSVRDNEIWTLPEHGESIILPALRLSYNNLPPILRQCFAYCSIYPKDYSMEKEKLIHQWMANGFIQSTSWAEVEDIGDEVFSELLRLSFFQDMQEINKLQEVRFKMHNLMHDLACSVMLNDCSIMKFDEISNISKKARHVSVVCESAPSPATSNTLFKSPPACRTVLFLDQKTTPPLDHCVSSLSRFKYLRVLDLSYVWTIKVLPPIFGRLKHLRYLNLCNVDLASLPKSVCNLRNLQILNLSYNSKLTVLPSSIGNLKRLRCLDLSGCGIMVFPESICNLTNLRTLNLYECLKLKMLPKSLRNMRNLRSLVIDKHATELTCMPLGIGQLACLRELSTFAVSPVSESAGIRELEELNHLKGELTITGLQHVCDPRDAEQAKLRSKEKLSELRLIWTDGDVEGNNSKEVLERLEPHPNVQVLVIDGYPGVMLPSWVGSSAALISLSLFSMPNVEGWCPLLPSRLGRLELYGCPKLKLSSQLPSSIKVLAVEKCNDPMLNAVKKLPILSYLCISGFAQAETLPEAPLQNLTCLETFIIRDCDKLKSLPTELENLMTLRSLEIGNCGGLESLTEGLSNLTCLKRLAIHNCRSLKSLSQSSLQHLSALETLLLRGCPDLEIMSLGYQHLIALQDLELTSFPQLISFPEEIQHASRLEMLTIYDCKNLRALPDWLLALPVLSKLHISRCHPDLHRRCKDWNRIPHLRFLNEEL